MYSKIKTSHSALIARTLGLIALAVAMLVGSTSSEARLDPYFFLRNRTFSKITPRILFALDSSGSMDYETDGPVCEWDECEDVAGSPPDEISRVAGARAAVNAVAVAATGNADFSLMTFNHQQPPATAAALPADCNNDGYRFRFIDEYYGNGSWSATVDPWGTTGAWALCGTNKPFPYLRWDELGFTNGPGGSNNYYPNDSDLPPGPLALQGSSAQYHDDSPMSPMRWRDVQFFGEFLGVRINLDCSTAEGLARATISQGDYLLSDICGQDFYYWPYVDGFAGYSQGVYGGDWMGRGNYPWCPAADEIWTCKNWTTPPGFTTCQDQDQFGNDCFIPAGPKAYQTCAATYGWSNCQRYEAGGPWSGSFGNRVWYSECNTLPDIGDAEDCCEWIGEKWGEEDACKVIDVPKKWGSTCGADEACCEAVALGAGLGVEDCKGFSGGVCGEWELTGCNNWQTNVNYTITLGTHERSGSDGASLLAPFFFQPAIDDWAGDPDPNNQVKTGPLTAGWANNLVQSLTAHQMYGGMDAQGGTPWGDAVGTLPVVSPDSNAAFSHSTIASYLNYIDTKNTDQCRPTYAVIISDGYPNNGATGSALANQLAALRNTLSVKTYVVGFGISGGQITQMACGAAGALNGSCLQTPGPGNNDYDTCQNPQNPSSNTDGCAWIANDPQELASKLITIVNGALDISIPSGPGTSMNNFGLGASGDEFSQVRVVADTEYPSWQGHVKRELCDATDPNTGVLLPHCQPPSTTTDEMDNHSTFTSSGQCPPSWTWDAGDCLRDTPPTERRLYSHNAFNTLYEIGKVDANGDVVATNNFATEFQNETGIVLTAAEQDSLVQFVYGVGWPGDDGSGNGWKLPGLAYSAPTPVRRIPEPDANFLPSVGIRDPHCSGRVIAMPTDLPKELIQFAGDAWIVDTRSNGEDYHKYQEAVLVGDDLGILHAFQLMSGNELFGLVPRFNWQTIYEEWQIGAAASGQPSDIAAHKYGVSATANHGWVWDKNAGTWRHLVIIGLGAGGEEFMALDVSHMGELEPGDTPVDVLWTTDDTTTSQGDPLEINFENWMGETWSRPAITYRYGDDPGITNNPDETDLGKPPDAFLVMASGYEPVSANPDITDPRGRRVWLTEAVTGKQIEFADIPQIDPAKSFETEYFGMVVDPAVSTHCTSRFWAEMQEVYFIDPYGRLFRWDQGFPAGHNQEHEGDSHYGDPGLTWAQDGDKATEVKRFYACRGDDPYLCSVDTGNQFGDPFFYTPAVLGLNRLDDPTQPPQLAKTDAERNQFLLAMVSGSINDDATTDPTSDFHPSVYLLVDNHAPDHPNYGRHQGFNIPAAPAGGPINNPGDEPHYLRMAVTDINRQRCLDYPNGTSGCDSGPAGRPFSKYTRPIRAPRIGVTGIEDTTGTFRTDIEVVTISYTLYEPGDQGCDSRWQAPDGTWYYDSGSTWEVEFKLPVKDNVGFDFQVGTGGTEFDNVPGFGGPGLTAPVSKQLDVAACAGGYCGPQLATNAATPCDPNQGGAGQTGRVTVPVAWSEITGFTPIE